MKFSMIKKLGAVICCAAVLCSSMVFGASTSEYNDPSDDIPLKNIVI